MSLNYIHDFVSLCLNSILKSAIPHRENKAKSYPFLNVRLLNEWYLL